MRNVENVRGMKSTSFHRPIDHVGCLCPVSRIVLIKPFTNLFESKKRDGTTILNFQEQDKKDKEGSIPLTASFGEYRGRKTTKKTSGESRE